MSYKQGTVQHRDSLRTEGIKFHYYRKNCNNKMEKWEQFVPVHILLQNQPLS